MSYRPEDCPNPIKKSSGRFKGRPEERALEPKEGRRRAWRLRPQMAADAATPVPGYLASRWRPKRASDRPKGNGGLLCTGLTGRAARFNRRNCAKVLRPRGHSA